MKRLVIAAAVLLGGLTAGCESHRDFYKIWQQEIIYRTCWINNKDKSVECPTWVLSVGRLKTPIAVFWGYKDSQHNMNACLAAREVEPNSECYPILGF